MNHRQSASYCLMYTLYQNKKPLSRKIWCEMIHLVKPRGQSFKQKNPPSFLDGLTKTAVLGKTILLQFFDFCFWVYRGLYILIFPLQSMELHNY